MHVVVLGGGYAGLSLTRGLERRLPEGVELTLVDETGDHLLQHELHRVVRRPTLVGDVRVPLEAATDRAHVRVDTVETIDAHAGHVELSGGAVSYDVGAICVGGTTAVETVPGVRRHGLPLKRLDHAHEIHERALEVFAEGGRIVVAGAGLSGVQVAGELAALASERDARDVEVLLFERERRVAPRFSRAFSDAVRDELAAAGVAVRTRRRITAVDESTVSLAERDDVAHDLLVWTGGIRGADALDGERPTVRSDLRLTDRTVALGDAARVIDDHGQLVDPSAQAAVRAARTAATNVDRLVRHRLNPGEAGFEPRLERFTFESRGWIVSVGDRAVAQAGPTVLRGRAAAAVKTTVDAGYLTSIGAVRDAMSTVGEAVSG